MYNTEKRIRENLIERYGYEFERRKSMKKRLRGRCAITGRFITLKEAKRRKRTAIIERY